jgi:hypothetical protein
MKRSQITAKPNNEAGFMLVQVIIGFGLFAILMSAMISFYQYSDQFIRNSRATQSFSDLVKLVQMNLDDVKSCTFNLGKAAIGSQPGGLPLKLYQYDNSRPTFKSDTENLLVAPDQVYDNLIRILSVTLRRKAQVSDTRSIASVTIKAEKTGSIQGSKEISQTFPVYITMDAAGEVTACYGNFSASGVIQLQQKVCELMSDGDYYWDDNAQKCMPRYEIKCFDGPDEFRATCGAGSKNVDSCNATNVYDPAPVSTSTRTYVSSRQRPMSPPPGVACEPIDTMNIECDYASDVIRYPGNLCQACCKWDKLYGTTPP